MKRMKFKSRLLALVVCVFAWVGANAQNVETITETVNGQAVQVVVVTSTATGQMSNLSPADKQAIQGASYLRLKGPFSSDDFNKLKDTGCSPETLDLRNANIDNSITLAGGLKSDLETLYMPEASTYTTIAAEFCSDATHLSYVEFPSNITTIGRQAFAGTTSLTSVTLPSNLQYIQYQAFRGSALTSISIPGTVKHIYENAFIDCHGLTSVTIEEHKGSNGESDVDMVIETQVFRQGDHIMDVYINTLGHVECKNEAFDFATTFGHGDTNAQVAVLHYPPSKVKDYCNMEHVLTHEIAMNTKDFHEWLLDHYDLAKSSTYHNGWYEFVNSGPSSEEDVIVGKVLKTYSFYYNVTDYAANGTPITLAKLVPQGVKAYIVNNVSKNNTTGNWEVTLKSIFAIPANTGVLLYGTPNSKVKNANGEETAALVMNTVAYEGLPLVRGNTTFNSSDSKNMLLPTSTDREGNEVTQSILVTPYETGDDGKVTFRNFFMTMFSSTDLASSNNVLDYVGFFRAKRSRIAKGKAYLHMAASTSEYNSAKGAEAVILQDQYYKREYTKDGDPRDNHALWANRDWSTDWGTRSSSLQSFNSKYLGEPFFEDLIENEEGITTLIIPCEDGQTLNEVYYTLQGVRVNNPTKGGVYIQNGKKVIVR